MEQPVSPPQKAGRLRRFFTSAFGLTICGVGTYLQMQASIGMFPWNSFKQGLSIAFPISFGTASILVSLVILLLDILLGEPIGVGTILDAFLMGIVVDICTWLNFVPLQQSFVPQVAMLLFGLMVMNVGQVLYMGAGLSCGPTDTFMVALGKRVSYLPIGLVSILISAVVLAIGVFLGSPFGVGTLISLFGSGTLMEFVFRLFHFDPRDVEQESLIQTIKALLP